MNYRTHLFGDDLSKKSHRSGKEIHLLKFRLKSLSFIIIFIFVLQSGNAQKALPARQIDSIVAEMDKDSFLREYITVDSLYFKKETGKVPMYTYKIGTDGKVVKIQVIYSGNCDAMEQFFYVKERLVKALIRMDCNGQITYDSDIYYQNNIVLTQTDRAEPLYGLAFQQSAHYALTRVKEFRSRDDNPVYPRR